MKNGRKQDLRLPGATNRMDEVIPLPVETFQQFFRSLPLQFGKSAAPVENVAPI
jgi:hypothetical protein